MGVCMQSAGDQGKKSLDAELNLIPFIDLLICCICFLLITAVWTQLAHIKVTQQSGGRSETNAPVKLRVAVLVGDDGYTLTMGSQRQVISRKHGAYDTLELGRALRKVRAAQPGQSSLTVAAEDGIAYKHLVRTLDIARQASFHQIDVRDMGAVL